MRQVTSYCIQDLIAGCLWKLPLSFEQSGHWLVRSESWYLEAGEPAQMGTQVHILVSDYSKLFGMQFLLNSLKYFKISMRHTVWPMMIQTSRKRFSSQVEELEMVEVDPVELPDGPPSPLQKALAGWELSEQQGETQALSQRGQTLKKR